MAFDVFTKDELRIAKKISLWGFWIVLVVVVFSAVMQVIEVYTTEGGTGLTIMVKEKGGEEQTLKEHVDTQIQRQPTATTGELPLNLSIPSLGVNAAVQSPGAASTDALDDALKLGPVYYSGSGYPGVRNMLIFGHSTGISIVHNQAYKVFNNLKNAKAGDFVYVRSVSGVSTYRVTGVKKASKYSTWIDFNSDKPKLTLSTCDSFGKASDRWVLEADFVSFAAGR